MSLIVGFFGEFGKFWKFGIIEDSERPESQNTFSFLISKHFRTTNQPPLGKNFKRVRWKLLMPSLKSINKSNICTNNSFIYINISFILTNISFIYTFLRGGANFLPRCYRFRIPENNVNDKGWYKRTASFCRSEPVLYSSF